ncbi:MAG: CsbD family protein [Actinomycetota bacterium]
MDKDRIKGKAEDIAGRVKRQAGEWTGDEKAQAEGSAKQLKGKARNLMGRARDAARDASEDLREEDVKRDEDAA